MYRTGAEQAGVWEFFMRKIVPRNWLHPHVYSWAREAFKVWQLECLNHGENIPGKIAEILHFGAISDHQNSNFLQPWWKYSRENSWNPSFWSHFRPSKFKILWLKSFILEKLQMIKIKNFLQPWWNYSQKNSWNPSFWNNFRSSKFKILFNHSENILERNLAEILLLWGNQTATRNIHNSVPSFQFLHAGG